MSRVVYWVVFVSYLVLGFPYFVYQVGRTAVEVTWAIVTKWH